MRISPTHIYKEAEAEGTTPERYLLKGPMPELSRMKKRDLKVECEMWRRLWQWVPSEVKYYVARTGSMVGITQRNYKRYLGILLDTHWTLEEIELGVYDKVYDPVSGQYWFERKIVKVKIGSIIDLQWIAEREPEEKVVEEARPEAPISNPEESNMVEQ